MRGFICIFAVICMAAMVATCSNLSKRKSIMDDARELLMSGEFSRLIELAADEDPGIDSDGPLRRSLDSLADRARRFMIDFPLTSDDVLERLRADSVDAGEDDLRRWEDAGELEYIMIDGERRYFRWAHRNLYRINDELRQKMQIDRERDSSLAAVCMEQIGQILGKTSIAGPGIPINPETMVIRYTITVDAGAVPPGETIRCWMPWPREDIARQDMVRLLSSSPEEYILSPPDTPQRSIYFEQVAVSGEPAVFSMEAEFRSWSQYFPPALFRGRDPGDGPAGAEQAGSALPAYVTAHTGERPPHIRFSSEIIELAGSLVAEGMTQYEKVRAFYHWINDNIIWTSAIEYGLMSDIPSYVLENRRGDCGMQTLLFISLCRYAGIPARWQSGWMMHPGHVNLHDWAEVWLEPAGWVPVDVSFKLQPSPDPIVSGFYITGMDSYRMTVNNDYGRQFYPPKGHVRSEPLDFQRGELEWRGGNLYFDQWRYRMEVEYR
ncbi:MAG: transglutaminase domain-containing protein [Marinilabiliales bacterium]|nr:MAG: transglutaminase domain-containing protein [Marinilabiliales bacterium]